MEHRQWFTYQEVKFPFHYIFKVVRISKLSQESTQEIVNNKNIHNICHILCSSQSVLKVHSPGRFPKPSLCLHLDLLLSPGKLTAGPPWPAPTGPCNSTQLLHYITPKGHITVIHFSTMWVWQLRFLTDAWTRNISSFCLSVLSSHCFVFLSLWVHELESESLKGEGEAIISAQVEAPPLDVSLSSFSQCELASICGHSWPSTYVLCNRSSSKICFNANRPFIYTHRHRPRMKTSLRVMMWCDISL